MPKFVSGLTKQQAISSTRIEQFNARSPSSPRRDHQIKKDRLKAAVDKYGSMPTFEFLRGVAHCC